MADTKISALPAATDLLNADFVIVQGGGNKKASSALFGRNGKVLTVTSAGTTAVPAGTTAVIINLSGAGSVTLTLPKVADQAGIPLGISDWGGNATVTLTPDGSEVIMGVAGAFALGASSGQGLGLALVTTLNPRPTLSGWFVC